MKVTVLILLVVLLTSCGVNEKELLTNDLNESENSIINQPIKSQSNNIEDSIVSNEKKLEIKEVNYTNTNVKISYPEIINLDNLEQMKKVNEILKSDAMKAVDYYGGNEQGIELQFNYVTKWIGNSSFSVQYIGSSYVKDGAYPNAIYFTTNLDIESGKKLLLKDIVKIDDEFIDLLREAKYVPYDSDLNVESEAREELNNYSNAELISYMNKSDEISDKNELGVFTYLTIDSLGISASVPHALGDHVQFEIKYNELKNQIFSQNTAWSDLLPIIEN